MNLGPQFDRHEADLVRRRSVWQEPGNEHHIDRLLEKHGQEAPDLYRGIAVTASRNYLDPHKTQVGDRLHLPVSSFSSDRDTAVEFAHGDPEEHGHNYTPVMLHAQGARGVDISHASNLPWEKEWLSKGQFEVVKKSADPDNDIGHVFHLRPVD